MACVIIELCVDTKDNSFVEVCPFECIHPTPKPPDSRSSRRSRTCRAISP
jgi:hypothetical protein